MWRLKLHNHRRHAILHFGERHGIDDLVANAIIILTTKVRLAPEIVKLHSLHGLGDLFWIETLGFLHRRDKGKSRIGKIDTGGIPLTIFLGVTFLPALERLRQRSLDITVYPHTFDIRFPCNTRHDRSIDLADMDKPSLEAQFA